MERQLLAKVELPTPLRVRTPEEIRASRREWSLRNQRPEECDFTEFWGVEILKHEPLAYLMPTGFDVPLPPGPELRDCERCGHLTNYAPRPLCDCCLKRDWLADRGVSVPESRPRVG